MLSIQASINDYIKATLYTAPHDYNRDYIDASPPSCINTYIGSSQPMYNTTF
jgi:hypothetical protein